MFGIGTGELLLIALIALLVLGPERMPQLMRDVGKAMSDLRKTSDELQRELLNADKTLSAEKMLDVATRATASVPAAPPDSLGSQGPLPVGATQAEVTTPTEPETPAEPEETAFDREVRLARERIDRAGTSGPPG
jgi:Tat protein translocase TatB subunit